MNDLEKQPFFKYKECFGTDSGKWVLDDLRRKFNFDLSVIPKDNHGMTDIYEVLRNEGKRSVILHILKCVNKDLDKSEPETDKEVKYI